jgi:hypothetical protein
MHNQLAQPARRASFDVAHFCTHTMRNAVIPSGGGNPERKASMPTGFPVSARNDGLVKQVRNFKTTRPRGGRMLLRCRAVSPLIPPNDQIACEPQLT